MTTKPLFFFSFPRRFKQSGRCYVLYTTVDACRDRSACMYQRRYVYYLLGFPLFCNFFVWLLLGQQLLDALHLLNAKSFAHIGSYIGIFGSSALLAFSLEFSEFLLVSNTSSLTLSVSGIFKVK
jgi:hypothetical protein